MKIIYVDIDNTICNTIGAKFDQAVPYLDRIDKINDLYEAGNAIIYWTARGTTMQIDYRELTEKQLKSWGAKYTALKMGKPYFDLFIDDRNINSDEYFK